MTKQVPNVPYADRSDYEVDVWARRNTGEGAESAMAALRDRRNIDYLINLPPQLDNESAPETSG